MQYAWRNNAFLYIYFMFTCVNSSIMFIWIIHKCFSLCSTYRISHLVIDLLLFVCHSQLMPHDLRLNNICFSCPCCRNVIDLYLLLSWLMKCCCQEHNYVPNRVFRPALNIHLISKLLLIVGAYAYDILGM